MHIRVHGIRVYRKSSFVFVGKGKKVDERAICVWRIVPRDPSCDFLDVQQEKRNGFLDVEDCDIGTLLPFDGRFDKYWKDNARPVC